MPELPEVETTMRGIVPHLLKTKIINVAIRHYNLRWPIINNLSDILIGQTLQQITRRAKYLLFSFDHGTLIMHLGMSGRLSLLETFVPAGKHDHCDLIFSNKKILRYTDPRRFGAIIWTNESPEQHRLLNKLGPEPLTAAFNPSYLHQLCQTKSTNIKSLIMNSHYVVGVGNIYANEALFLAHINPSQSVQMLDQAACKRLTVAIKQVLKKAIRAGGTSLKDFLQADGKLGYFKQQLQVYGKNHQPCPRCQQAIVMAQQQQRATYFCPSCQPLVKLAS